MTGYVIERRLVESQRWLKIGKTADITYKDIEVVEDNVYEYRIMAENKAGVGEPCSPVGPVAAKDPWSTLHIIYRTIKVY